MNILINRLYTLRVMYQTNYPRFRHLRNIQHLDHFIEHLFHELLTIPINFFYLLTY